jgi:hypothetical protein
MMSGDEWTLQSGLDGDELLSRPGIELVPVDADLIRRAEKLIDGCEHRHKEDADIPFDWILDKVTGRSGATTDYILTEPARCPICKHEGEKIQQHFRRAEIRTRLGIAWAGTASLDSFSFGSPRQSL